jgi:hypothetical protein
VRLTVLLLLCSTAFAEPLPPVEAPPPVGASVAVGVGLAVSSLAAGSALLATADKDTGYAQKKAGFHIIADGLFLAPVVSHLIAREWKRAAVWGAITLALGAAAIGILEGTDSLLDEGTPTTRVTFGAAVALELFASAAGIIDSMLAGQRYRDRQAARQKLMLWPTLRTSSQGFSVGIGGTL